jgi:hypothetical protein
MNSFGVEKCVFKDILSPEDFSSENIYTHKEFQELCNNKIFYMYLWLLLTPFIYSIVLLIEKIWCKNKYNS